MILLVFALVLLIALLIVVCYYFMFIRNSKEAKSNENDNLKDLPAKEIMETWEVHKKLNKRTTGVIEDD